jgi:signal transduction histidine kinase
MNMRRRILLLLISSLSLAAASSTTLSGTAQASETIQLGPDFSSERIDSKVDSWLGPNERSVQELTTATAQRTGNLLFGYTNSVIWLRFSVSNTQDKPRNWILSVNPPLIDRVEMTEFTQEGQIAESSVFNVNRLAPLPPKTTRAMPRRQPTFSINIPSKTSRTVILRLESHHTIDVHLFLSTPEADEVHYMHEQLIYGAYYGLFFTIFLLNLILYIATRERLYLSYLAFLSSLFLMISCLNGILDLNFGEYFDFSRYLGMLASLTVMFGNLFSRNFLQTNRIAPKMDILHRGLAVAAFLFAIIDVTPLFPKLSVLYGHSIDFLIAASILTIITSTLVTYRKGHRPAIFFLFAWGTFLTFTSLYFVASYGLVPGSIFTHSAVQIGSSLEMILLSIALGFRVYTLKEEKIAAEKKAEEADSLRSLIHIICHDLRNPLTVMSGHAEMQLRRGKTEWRPVARAAQTQKEILDYVQIKEAIETGKKQLTLVPVNLVEAVENARFLFEDRMEEKKIRWDAQFDASHTVLADPTLLTYTVISNLISNAIKFTSANGLIEIRSRMIGTEIELEVRDTGIGIPKTLIKNLFSGAVATTRAGTDGEQGTGFGMPLVKTVMEFFGGSILVRSSVAGKSSPHSPCEASGTSMILRLKRAD